MYWFPRPPYFRYSVAACIVLVALWLDLRTEPTERYPFAPTDLAAGMSLTTGDVEWRDVPADLFEVPSIQGVLTRSVAAGEPLRASDFTTADRTVPEGWWSLQLDLPPDLIAGQALRLIILPTEGIEPPDPIPAMVVAAGASDSGVLGSGGAGRIAVPPDVAATAAAAVAENRVTLLIGSLR